MTNDNIITSMTAHCSSHPEMKNEWKDDEALARTLTVDPNGIDDENDPEFVPYNQREWNLGSYELMSFIRRMAHEERENVKDFVKDVIAKMNPDGKFDTISYKCDNFGWKNQGHMSNAMPIEKFLEDPVGVIAMTNTTDLNSPEFSQEWTFANGVLTVTQYYQDWEWTSDNGIMTASLKKKNFSTGEMWEFRLSDDGDDNTTATTAHYTSHPELKDEWKDDNVFTRVLTVNPNGINDENDPEFVPFNQREWKWGSDELKAFVRGLENAGREDVERLIRDAIAKMNPDGKFDTIAYKCDNWGRTNQGQLSGTMDIDIFMLDPVRVITPVNIMPAVTPILSQDWTFENGVLTAVQYHRDAPNGEVWEFHLFADGEGDK